MKPSANRAYVIVFVTHVLTLGLLSADVFASVHWHCSGTTDNLVWPDEELNWRAGKNSFQSGTGWRDALTLANGRWNQAPGGFEFGIRNWNETYVGRKNGQNEIWFSDDQDDLDGHPAICWYRYSCSGSSHKWKEMDVIFDADRKWSITTTQSTKTTYGGDYRPWGNTALHEMGHALGLAHENDTYNIMGQDWDHIHANDGEVRHYAGEDAGDGEVHLYGMNDNTYKNDVGVSHWKYGGADGAYSEHIPCCVYSTSGTTVHHDEDFNGFKRYHVEAGKSYKVEFTFENNGYYDQHDVDVAYYISTDYDITTLDGPPIATTTMNINRNDAFDYEYTVTIPSSKTVGSTYYLGVFVDYTSSIMEYSVTNNATYLPIFID